MYFSGKHGDYSVCGCDTLLFIVYRYQYFGRICCPILYAEMVVLGSSKVSVFFYQTLCCHIPEYGSPQLLNH